MHCLREQGSTHTPWGPRYLKGLFRPKTGQSGVACEMEIGSA